MEKQDLVNRTQVSMTATDVATRISQDIAAVETKLRGLHAEARDLRAVKTDVVSFRGDVTERKLAMVVVKDDITAAGVDLRRLKASRAKL